ncbi:MAG TPA: carboxypeptidase regulatory-like domain-containing protein, partial [Bryobacteraceae bacterium]|nr:carboxypeptidase regulatory-like domain-containing protein [Bryobacteraceae bacterium]
MRQCIPWVLALAANLGAQSHTASGELHGRVYDPSGAVVTGAAVTLTRASIGLKLQTVSGNEGEYTFIVVPPGQYAVEVTKSAFQTEIIEGVRVVIGEATTQDVRLRLGTTQHSVLITGEEDLIDTGQTQQSATILQESIANLPIDRRDYLTFALLVPGVVDATAIADNTDLRVKQAPHTGLSFGGSNGRGNTITIDGSEANDGGGGARSTLPQEAVQEFQIHRSNYSAELGGASGGAIDIVSRSGTNQLHGSVFDFLRNQALDAGNPFARIFDGSRLVRIKPPSKRNQFGGSFSGPIRKDRMFLFLAFEGLIRRESSVVSILTNPSIFELTPNQLAVINVLPAAAAAGLRSALRLSQNTRDLFARNSGVFPFDTDAWRFSARFDHHRGDRNYFLLRHNFSHIDESNANLQALVGATRGNRLRQFDPTTVIGWTHMASPHVVNEARFQGAYRQFSLDSLDPYGPELRIAGFGIFNHDYLLPSRNFERRFELRDSLTRLHGRHTTRLGGQALLRGTHSESEVFFGGRFTFGDLPGALLDPNLPASFTINSLQAFNLGLAQTYLQGFGNPTVASLEPSAGLYIQDSWQVSASLRLDLGLRYELDVRKPPVPTSKTNFAPRVSFAWSPLHSRGTVIRGGYGLYYSPIYYQIDWTATALNNIDGRRQIGQAFTSILTPGPAAANNVFTVLRNQGIIGIPTPSRAIQARDLTQFGISFPQSGPLPPFTVLYGVTPDFR